MKNKGNKIFSKGLTLIELIVALSIFALIVPLATNLLVAIIQDQRKLLVQQDLLNHVNYLNEYMSRALRTAIRSNGTECLGEPDKNYKVTIGGADSDSFGGSGTGIKFINHTDNDSCQWFYLEGQKLKEKKKNIDGTETINDLTPGNYVVNNFDVFVSPDPVTGTIDKYQPRVTFSIDLQSSAEQENPPEVKAQTTVSQRNLNL